MFSGLRENSLFYVLEKGEKPVLKVGNVMSVSNQRPKFGAYGSGGVYGAQMETVVDVKVKLGEDVVNLEGLPSQLSIADKDGIVVSESREALCADVDAMLRASRAVLDSMDYHRNVVECCEGIIQKLNPQIAKEKEQERKIDALEEKMGGMESTLTNIQTMLSEALNKSVTKKS